MNNTPKGSIFSGFYNIQDTPESFTAKKKWKSFYFYIIPLLLGGFFAYMWLSKGVIWPGLLALFVFYIGLCGVLNSYKIKIDKNQVLIKQGPLPLPLMGLNKPMSALTHLSVDAKFSRTGRRMYSQNKGFHNETSKSSYELMGHFNGRQLSILSFKTIEIEYAEYLRDKIKKLAGLSENAPSGSATV